MGSLFDPEYVAQLTAAREKIEADHNFTVTLGSNLSFDETLAKMKLEAKAKRLYLRGWEVHPTGPGLYYREVEGGFDIRSEAALEARWPSVDLCESPIEVSFYEAIVGRDLHGFKMELQYETIAVDRYRMDFAFFHSDGRRICIEADGFAHHERTKEQAQYDRQRDRRLTFLRWRCLRFTGSEIFRDANACALEAIEHMR